MTLDAVVQPVDTTTTAFVGSSRGHLVAAAQHFFANGGIQLCLLHVEGFEDDPAAAFARLDAIGDLSLLASPGHGSGAAISAGASYCSRRGNCFFLADSPAGEVRSLVAGVGVSSSYAALFVPWLDAEPPAPASAFVAGVLAGRPVWDAPAGVVLRGATGLAEALSDSDRASLEALGVNALRASRTGEIAVGSSSTLAPPAQPEWKYVDVRRLAVFLEESIDRGTQWTVFEPNDEPLWAKLRRSIGAFLAAQWRLGAFVGEAPEEGYFVECDRTTMTQSDIDAGRLNVVVGFAPLRPAEFVVLRIGLWAARDDPDP